MNHIVSHEMIYLTESMLHAYMISFMIEPCIYVSDGGRIWTFETSYLMFETD